LSICGFHAPHSASTAEFRVKVAEHVAQTAAKFDSVESLDLPVSLKREKTSYIGLEELAKLASP
jgi:hypothetical protein